MNCPVCESAVEDTAKFCSQCGGALSSNCANCGSKLPSDAKFCPECGTSVEATKAAASPQPIPKNYTPKHLADKILQSRAALEGERKQVTVMFADVQGSMDLAEQLGGEEWHVILDRFFEILAEGVHRFEGTINQYTGDGIMALFGAPIAHEDHSRRACYAALHLQETLSEYALELRRTRGLNFTARIGLNTGEVVVGKIGDDLRMDYTAQGLTVGLAQRMEQLAESGRIYVSDSIARTVEGFFELEDLGEFTVKGVSGPMHVFDLKGLGRLRTRLDVSRSRGFSTFVGRQDEMNSLDVALKNSLDGHGQCVGVVGEAGVGKSRLCYEFIQNSRAINIPVYEAHCPAHGQTIPYLPVLELWRNYFGINDRDTPDEARRKIAGTLVLLDSSLNDSLPLLFEFLGVPDPKRPAPSLDPDARQRQLIAFMRRVTQLRSEQEPSIIYIDDVHWIDPGSDQFLSQFVEAIDQTRTLCLLNFRPEYQPVWSHKPYYLQLPVVPLNASAIEELVRELLGDDASVTQLPELIRRRTAGNPFFIEEVIQTLVESGQLSGTRGSYRLIQEIESLQIPKTVHAILAARIDRLHDQSKYVLQTAAVIGKEFIQPVLEKVVEIATSELSTALQSLQSAEFIYEQALYPVAEYSFKHPLTQEVALDTQLQDRKRRVHAAVAHAIIGAAGDKLDESAALIAYHFEAAHDYPEAAKWNARAAEWVGASDPVGGTRHWQKVLDLGRQVSDDEQMDRLRLRACTAIQSIGGWRTGMSDDDVEAINEEGMALAEALGDRAAITTLDIQWAGYQSVLGRAKKFLERALQVEDEIEAIEDPDTYLSAVSYIAYGFYVAGDQQRARKYYAKADALTGEDVSFGLARMGYSVHLWAKGMIAALDAHSGRLESAREELERVRHRAVENGFNEELCWLTSWRTQVELYAGIPPNEADQLERWALDAIELSDRVGSQYTIILSRATLSICLAMRERWEEAAEQAEDALARMARFNTGLDMEPWTRCGLAMSQLGSGRPELAEKTLSIVREKSVQLGSSSHTTYCMALLAKSILAQPHADTRVEEVDSILKELESVIIRRGDQAVAPHVTECRALVESVCGRVDGAKALHREAHRQFLEMGATGHATRIKKTLEAVPQ